MLDTILFDLDGTLLPIEQEPFTKAYFDALTQTVSPLGYPPEEFVRAVWAGTKAMMQNDGGDYNRRRFWDRFASLLGERARGLEPLLEQFYQDQFHRLKTLTASSDVSQKLVRSLQDKGYQLILATNPIFPEVAVSSRLGWVGLSLCDFSFVTTYENSRYCKPDLRYYREIFDICKKSPSQCLMIGNSVREDMCARKLGARVYLVTDHLENEGGGDVSGYPQGSLSQLADFDWPSL